MGPPRPRAGTLAGGRRVGAGRGAGGARGSGDTAGGWRPSSLPSPSLCRRWWLSSLISRNRERLSSVRSPWSHLRMTPSRCPPLLCASWAPAVQAPLSSGFLQLGLRALLPFLGLWASALSRARGPGLSLDRAVPSPLRAPTPITRSPLTHILVRVRSPPPVERVRHKGS